MALIKCPRCSRRFESVAASRDHADAAHDDPGPSPDTQS